MTWYSRGGENTTYLLLALEGMISGFYITITRSLAPIFFTVIGFTHEDIIKLNLVGYLLALALAIAT